MDQLHNIYFMCVISTQVHKVSNHSWRIIPHSADNIQQNQDYGLGMTLKVLHKLQFVFNM